MINVHESSGIWPPKVRGVVLHFGRLRFERSKKALYGV